MNDPGVLSVSRSPREATQPYQGKVPSASMPRRRCRLALQLGGASTQLGSEIAWVLRGRLKIAALVCCAGFVAYTIRSLVEDLGLERTGPILIFQGVVIGILLMLALLLASRRPLSLLALRGIELAIFGTPAVFIAWLQFTLFDNGRVLQLACSPHESIVVRLAAATCGFRWFALVALYGIFIPNTWRRCAVVVSILALAPLLLTVAVDLMCGKLHEYLALILVEMGIMMGLAAAAAVFGSYKISELHQEAFEARRLGQYRLKKPLGAGGMGQVYLAEHELLRRPCAIKMIHPEQAGDPAQLSRFEREVRATATLTHWNTIEIYDYGHADDGTFYYVMEYLPGLSLQELVERHGPLPPERAIHFLRQVCRALREAHGIQLIHRDIKPSNVIACDRGGVYDVAKLVDFGLVQDHGLGKDADRLTIQGTVLGSPPYMSPEQAAGKTDLDGRTDVYSLGGVAYFLLTGQQPFVRETAMEMLLAHAYEAPRPPREVRPEVPADLEAVVLRCLEKDPNRRFPDADSLEKALALCGAAGQWTEELAAAWWRENDPRPGERETEVELLAAMKTTALS